MSLNTGWVVGLGGVFLVLGILSNIDQYISGFNVPGDPMTWLVTAIACGVLGGRA